MTTVFGIRLPKVNVGVLVADRQTTSLNNQTGMPSGKVKIKIIVLVILEKKIMKLRNLHKDYLKENSMLKELQKKVIFLK